MTWPKKTYFIITIAALIAFPAVVFSAGLNISPPKIQLNLALGETQAALAISNPALKEQNFKLSFNGYENFLRVEPSSFVLPAGGKLTVKLSVIPNQIPASDKLSATLSIVSFPAKDKGASLASGVKIPVQVMPAPEAARQESRPNSKNSHIKFWAGLLALSLLMAASAYKRF